MRRLALALCLLITAYAAGAIAAVPTGDEVQVNVEFTDGQQDDAQVTMDPDGDFTVAWQGDEPGAGGPDDVVIRRFANPGFGEIVANSETSGDQDNPSIASQANGDGVVAFHTAYVDGQGNPQEDIRAHRFDADGPINESDIDVDLTPSVVDENPAVAMDADGDFVVAWESGNGERVSARLFDETGAPVTDEFIVAQDNAGQAAPAVAMDDAGNFVVAWEGGAEGEDDQGIFARRYDAAGNLQDATFQVNTTTAGAQDHAAVAMDADGDFVAAWEGEGATDPNGVFVQRFDAAGSPQGSETLVNTTTAGQQGRPSVTMDDDGDFAVVWDGEGVGDDEPEGAFIRDFTAAGVPLASEALVNQTTPDQQQLAWVSSDADGDLVVSWETDFTATEDAEDVFVRRFARGTSGGGGNGGGGGGNGGRGGGTTPGGPSQVPPVLDDMGLPVLTDGDVGVKANVALVSGTVLLGIPPGLPTAAAVRRSGGASQKGVTFVPLTQARQIPIGSFLNARRGTVRLRTATGSQDGTQTGDFGRGLFQVLQSRAASARGLTTLVLKGSKFGRSRCGARRSSAGALASQVSRRTIRRLRSNARGRFRTRGRHSAATVRGTVWQTSDRCDGTLTKVTRGSVVVRDFRRRRNIVVRAGKRTKGPGGGRGSYLARAR